MGVVVAEIIAILSAVCSGPEYSAVQRISISAVNYGSVSVARVRYAYPGTNTSFDGWEWGVCVAGQTPQRGTFKDIQDGRCRIALAQPNVNDVSYAIYVQGPGGEQLLTSGTLTNAATHAWNTVVIYGEGYPSGCEVRNSQTRIVSGSHTNINWNSSSDLTGWTVSGAPFVPPVVSGYLTGTPGGHQWRIFRAF